MVAKSAYGYHQILLRILDFETLYPIVPLVPSSLYPHNPNIISIISRYIS